MSFVLPGVDEVLASLSLPHNMLISDDLPTFERPMNANSGSLREGFWLALVQLPANFASLMFIFLSAYAILLQR